MNALKSIPVESYPAQMVSITPNTDVRSQEEEMIDVRSIVQTVWRGKWIIAICTLLAATIGFLAVSQFEPTYRASAKVMFDIQQSNVVNIQDVLIDQQFDATKLEDQIQVLRSTTLIERVISELGLAEKPEFNPRLRPPEPSLADRFGITDFIPPALSKPLIKIGILSAPASPRDPVQSVQRERLNVINNVRAGLQLKPVGRSRVIEIGFVSGDPDTSAAIVNAIAEQYIVDQLEAKLEATRAATSWLSTRVDQLRIRVQNAEEAVESARSELSDSTGQTLEVTQQQLEALNGSLATARAEVSRVQSLFDRLTLAVEEGRDLGAISEFRASTLIQAYRSQETELLAERMTLQNTVDPSHPALARLDQQISDMRRTAQEEAKRIVSAAESDLKAAIAQETSLVGEVRRLEQKALVQSRNQVQLRQLDREADASRVLYENFLARLQETSEQEDLQEADARILSPAEEPLFPQGQAKRRVLMIATVFGGLIGLGLVFLLDRLNNTFRSPQQLEDLTGEALLGVLPTIGSNTKRSEVIRHLREHPNSSMAESVRNLRTSILYSNIDTPPKVIMFTSTIPREGKSTTSMLTAMTSRQMGKTAVIVDCDLRLPALARILDNNEEQPGLLSVLEGSSAVKDAVFKDPDTGLDILMTRRSERQSNVNAADVLSSKRFEELITELSGLYDLVILDTPPVLVVADARIISKLADAVVYAVRWDETPRGAVLEGLKELRSIDAPLAGMVMTLVNEDRAARYSYEGYSYYKGKYRDYYAN